MNSSAHIPVLSPKQRMKRALARLPVDRLPVQSNYTPRMGRLLASHLGISVERLPSALGNHLLRLDLACPRKESTDGKVSFDWWGAGWDTQTEGYWHAYAPLAASKDLDRFAWPDPDDPHLLDDARLALQQSGNALFTAPNLGMCLFERLWSLRGFDATLIDLVEDPGYVCEVLDRIVDIQVKLCQRFVDLGVDGGYFGDDYGAQKGMLFSPRLWRQLFKPCLARMFSVFRNARLPVILHSDGDIWAILPDLVEIGVTCLNPVQPEVLEHKRLYRDFGRQLSFYGGISTQTVLPSGSPEAVKTAAWNCFRDLAPDGTGLILGPSHRMQSDIPPLNVQAMLEACSEMAGAAAAGAPERSRIKPPGECAPAARSVL